MLEYLPITDANREALLKAYDVILSLPLPAHVQAEPTPEVMIKPQRTRRRTRKAMIPRLRPAAQDGTMKDRQLQFR